MTTTEGKRPLHVAISLGNADVAPIDGVSNEDVHRAHMDLARGLLQRGHVLVYGGDLKPSGGLSEELLGLAAEASPLGAGARDAPERWVRNGVAWPIHLRYRQEDLAPLKLQRAFEFFDPPADLALDDAARQTFVPPDTPERRVWWARSFRAMREQLGGTLDARVVVCGRGIGSSGAIPGILEECVVAVQQRTPLFLVGALGGVAVPLIEAFTQGTTTVFTREAQRAHEPMGALFDYLDANGLGALADFEAIVRQLHEAGVEGLCNGLSREENERLFTGRDWPASLELFLNGLERLRG